MKKSAEKITGLREDAFFLRGKRQNHLSTDQHREKNKELLLDVPHKKFLDLSLVFAVHVEVDNDGRQ